MSGSFFSGPFFAGEFLSTSLEATGGPGRYRFQKRKAKTLEEVADEVRQQRVEFGVIPPQAAAVIAQLAEDEVRDVKRLKREIERERLNYEAIYADYLEALRDALITERIASIYAEIAADREREEAEAIRIALEQQRLQVLRRKRLMVFILMSSQE